MFGRRKKVEDPTKTGPYVVDSVFGNKQLQD